MLPIVIIAGGLGTRLGQLTASVPKAMVTIDGRPFIDHQLRLLEASGFTSVVLCVGHLGKMISDHVGDGSRYGINVSYSLDGPRRIGTGGAVAKASRLAGEHFFVTYGDSYLKCDYQAIEMSYRDSGKLALMTVFRNNGQYAPSNVLYRSRRIEQYDKRHPSAAMQHIDYGVAAFDRSAFKDVDPEVSTDLDTVFQSLILRNNLAGFEIATRFYEIGTPQGLAETDQFLRTMAAND